MTRKLLIAVDDSDESVAAFNWAMKELYRSGDEVHMCHVVPRMQFSAAYGIPPVDFYPIADATSYEAVINKAEKMVSDRFLSNLGAYPELRPVVHIVKSEVDTDSVGHVLCKKAEELDVFCVVMASHNKGKLAEFFLGSVTQFCVHHSKKPVAVVRE